MSKGYCLSIYTYWKHWVLSCHLECLSQMVSSPRFSWTSSPLSKPSSNSVVFVAPGHFCYSTGHVVIWLLVFSPPSVGGILADQGLLPLLGKPCTCHYVHGVGLPPNNYPSFFLTNKTPFLCGKANYESWLVSYNHENQIPTLSFSLFP